MASFSLQGKLKSKFGLIVPEKKSKTPAASARSTEKRSIFDDSDDDDDAAIAPPPPLATKKAVEKSILDANDRAGQSHHVQKLHESALEEDASIFDYDAVYDRMKEAEQRDKLVKAGVNQQRESRYVKGMMKQAAERAKQEVRIQDRKLHRELQQELQENPELAGKMESFVTDAYRQQQEELKRLEAEERAGIEAEAKDDVTKKESFVGFYRNLLDYRSSTAEAVQRQLSSEGAHTAGIAPAKPDIDQSANKSAPSDDVPAKQEHKELRGGLNVMKKPAPKPLTTAQSGRDRQDRDRMRHERDRVTQDYERQMQQHEQEQKAKRELEEAELRAKWVRQTTNDSAAEARRRYEERKKQRQQQQPPSNTS